MMRKETKVIVYEPDVLFWGVAAGFHGYSISFIKQFGDAIYIKNDGLKKYLRYIRQLWRMGIRRPIINNLNGYNEDNSVVVGFTIPSANDEELKSYQGAKFFHLMDYYLDVSRNNEFLRYHGVDYVIGHTQMDKNCVFFNEYYPEYNGKVISLPFGYQDRFVNRVEFHKRKNIAIGLGSINPLDDPKLDDHRKRELLQFFTNQSYMHPFRRFIQTHSEEFSDEVESRFPSPEKQKDFSYDAVEVLNSYKMFINDCGLSNFPPARTYEGIACGCVMVAEDNIIYKDIGFVPGINYIGFEKGDYSDLKEKIRYYQEHESELYKLHVESLKLSKKYSHSNVAAELYKAICDRI